MTEKQRQQFAALRRALDGLTVKVAGNAVEINEYAAAIRPWVPGTAKKPVSWTAGVDVRIYGGVPYTCSQSHTHSGEEGWEPGPESSLWKEAHGTTKATARAFVVRGDNPYMAGEFCLLDGVCYRCVMDHCTWSPAVYPQGWELVAA